MVGRTGPAAAVPGEDVFEYEADQVSVGPCCARSIRAALSSLPQAGSAPRARQSEPYRGRSNHNSRVRRPSTMAEIPNARDVTREMRRVRQARLYERSPVPA